MSRQSCKRLRVISSFVLGASFLSACGIKGDLKRPGPIFDKSAKVAVNSQ